MTIIDAILNIFQSDTSNYFIVQPLQSLCYFLEKITEKKEDVQVCDFAPIFSHVNVEEAGSGLTYMYMYMYM